MWYVNKNEKNVTRLGGWRESPMESQDGARLKVEEFIFEIGHREHIRKDCFVYYPTLSCFVFPQTPLSPLSSFSK